MLTMAKIVRVGLSLMVLMLQPRVMFKDTWNMDNIRALYL